MSGDLANVALMEPMYPDARPEFEDAVLELSSEASGFAQQLNPTLRKTVGDLVRTMNCYYSNLIEGHNTELVAIERAMRNDYSTDLKKRNLQIEAKAHIEVQAFIDHGQMPFAPTSEAGIRWIHREFCSRLPPELLEITGDGMTVTMTPGDLRHAYVKIGDHVPPAPEHLEAYLKRFEEAYTSRMIGKVQKVIGVGAAHHRLAYIHPFFDGNGRVTRLVSHAMYRDLGTRSELWSISRGLARDVDQYKALLAIADRDRQGSRDGRGNLTEDGLFRFSKFFLDTALDQVRFMRDLLQIRGLLDRVEIWTEEEIKAKRLPKGSFSLLREAILVGEFPRGAAPTLTNYQERQARSVLTALVDRNLLVSDHPRGDVRLGIPAYVVERWFPSLYQPRHASAPTSDQDAEETSTAGNGFGR